MTFQFAFGPRIKKSAFFDATVRAGVSHFSTYNHVCFPVSYGCLLYTSPSPRDLSTSRMPSSA